MVRKVVLSTIVLVTGIITLIAAVVAIAWFRMAIDTRGEVDFDHALPIPPLADSSLDDDGTRVFDLTMQRGQTDFGENSLTPTFGFNQDFGGPTIRASRGEAVRFEITNELGETSTVHWHGMHLPAEMDGGPHQQIKNGRTWSPYWTIDQPAATTWYHPHVHGDTLRHVGMGLAGLFIIDDDDPVHDQLPREYGVDDVPMVVTDRQFNRDGSFDFDGSFFNTVGPLGDTIIVNGAIGPYHEVTTEKVRLRLLNASPTRVFNFGFDDNRSLAMIASDGGLLAEPHDTRRIALGPGERAEIVVDFTAGERTVLQSFPAEGISRWDGGSDYFDIAEFRVADTLRPANPLPEMLADIPEPDISEASTVREFDLAGHTINGRAMAMDRFDAVVERDVPEIWHIRNRDGSTHIFHVHDMQFRVIEYDGAPPPPELAGWKDTVNVPNGSNGVKILVRFSGYSDPDWPYMFHCHVLDHEDRGMMGQFVVVEPGQSAGTPPTQPDTQHVH